MGEQNQGLLYQSPAVQDKGGAETSTAMASTFSGSTLAEGEKAMCEQKHGMQDQSEIVQRKVVTETRTTISRTLSETIIADGEKAIGEQKKKMQDQPEFMQKKVVTETRTTITRTLSESVITDGEKAMAEQKQQLLYQTPAVQDKGGVETSTAVASTLSGSAPPEGERAMVEQKQEIQNHSEAIQDNVSTSDMSTAVSRTMTTSTTTDAGSTTTEASTAVAPSQREESKDRLDTAIPERSPCGRKGFYIPLGPSATSTDQIIILNARSTTEDSHSRATSMSTAVTETVSSSGVSEDSGATNTNTENTTNTAAANSHDRSEERLATAAVIGSPCGRTKFQVPLGPSATPTDQIVILKPQSTTEDTAPGGTEPAELKTAAAIGSPCGRTKLHLPLGPSATPTDQILILNAEPSSSKKGGHSLQSQPSAIANYSDFFSPTPTSGGRRLTNIDGEQWNLARNDNSDRKVSPQQQHMAHEPSPPEPRMPKGNVPVASKESPLSPIANTARLPSGNLLFKESVFEPAESVRTEEQQKAIDKILENPKSDNADCEKRASSQQQSDQEAVPMDTANGESSLPTTAQPAAEELNGPSSSDQNPENGPSSSDQNPENRPSSSDQTPQDVKTALPLFSPTEGVTTARAICEAAVKPDILSDEGVESGFGFDTNRIPYNEPVGHRRGLFSRRPREFHRLAILFLKSHMRPIRVSPMTEPMSNPVSPSQSVSSQTISSQAKERPFMSSFRSRLSSSAGRPSGFGRSSGTDDGSASAPKFGARTSSFRSVRSIPPTQIRRVTTPADGSARGRTLSRLVRGTPTESSTAEPGTTPSLRSATTSRPIVSSAFGGTPTGTSTSGSRFGRRIRPGDGYPTSTAAEESSTSALGSERLGRRLPSSRFGLPPPPVGWAEKVRQRQSMTGSAESPFTQSGASLRTIQISSATSTPRPKMETGRLLPQSKESSDSTQKESPDARSDRRGQSRDANSPPLKTAIGPFDELSLHDLTKLKPGEIVVHEQNDDGTFKLEIHMACNMNSTGRMNIHGKAPTGLAPKKVTVNGKEIWAEM
ncbi:hypothetical protein NECAME_09576 [Necator americanus]|uniref:Uncharacterized protein n=1 Tax=Necator americanus TaxID=51031 RepID=W2TF80_NECAM|nr:hypothetical protein NECAME_09576 [Necator americanus]ETN79821.1 hypothetical protein NECAME_09576 [Necator americanus]